MVNISQTQETIATNPTSAALGNSGGKTVNYSASTTVKSDIVVSLPLSYVEKINGNVVYTSNKDANVAFSVNHKLSKFDRVDFTSNRYYHDDGERKYYN